MSNSKLVSYTKLTPHCTKPRKGKIQGVAIHCMAGNLTVEQCGQVFQTRKASSHYGIGSDGRIAQYVDEKDRAWCTSNDVDHKIVTIEVANSIARDPWPITQKAYNSLVDLLTDICQRNGIKKLVWSSNKADRVGWKNGCNMMAHRDYAAKACPGDYIYSRENIIADTVNKRLSGETIVAKAETTVSNSYKVKVTTDVLNIREGPSVSRKKAGKVKAGEVYTITETRGEWGKLKSGAGWISLKYTVKV